MPNLSYDTSFFKTATPEGQTLGEMVNLARGAQQYQKERELYQSDIEKSKAESEKSKTELEKSKLNLQAEKYNKSLQIAGASANDSRLQDLIKKKDSSGIIDYFIDKQSELKRAGLSDAESMAAIAPLVTLAHKAPQNIIPALRNIVMQGVGSEGQASQGFVPASQQAQYVTNPITGEPMPVGRTETGAPTGVVPTTKSQFANNQGNGSITGGFGGGAGGNVVDQTGLSSAPLRQQPNESPENFNQRVKAVQGSYLQSQDQFANTQSQFGHIPTIKTINNNILTLLKDEKVDTGAVQGYLAGRTNYANLNPKEQELAKYLQQRIQNLTPKSDADAENKKMAYGNLSMKKEALMDLVRQDNAWVAQQDLLAKGRINAGGNPANPNTGRIADFNNKFALLSQDPAVFKYIAIVGENPKSTKLDKNDIEALQKDFGKLSKDDLNKLEQKRQLLLQLVGAR